MSNQSFKWNNEWVNRIRSEPFVPPELIERNGVETAQRWWDDLRASLGEPTFRYHLTSEGVIVPDLTLQDLHRLITHPCGRRVNRLSVRKDILAICEYHAIRAQRGGMSHARMTPEERIKYLPVDQLVGQIAELHLHLVLFGPEGLIKYHKHRCERNKVPHIGDGGRDVDGYPPVDAKGRRYLGHERPNTDFEDIFWYNLVVDPDEYHPETRYVHFVVDLIPPVSSCLIGWEWGDHLILNETGPLAGKYINREKNRKKEIRQWSTWDLDAYFRD